MRGRVIAIAALLIWLAVIMGGCAGGVAGNTALASESGIVPQGDTAAESTEDGDLSAASVLNEVLFGAGRAESVEIIILLTVLTLLPSILIMLTGFVRIVIVLSFVRNAMGTQSMPPNQVVIALALFLTLMVMWPVFTEINESAYVPYVNEQIGQEEAITLAMEPIREFMLHQTYSDDLEMFFVMARAEPVESVRDTPNYILIPAFLTSEIKTAFMLGFFIFIPFLVIDMVVASTLMAMGMMMLPPIVISLPFKVLYFVLVDGWLQVITRIVESFKW